MIPMENVQAGLARFIDRSIAPSLSGWDRVLVAGAGGLFFFVGAVPTHKE